ncbi:MAG TPA: NAD(+) diphosphatase [Vitreimonas sp.]|jgi:NAD+ diphosphatase|nr:NAD(+) diphosphatase [Vitreimonas sp.]
MILPPNPNYFARSPLDRAGHRRRDEAWLKAALVAPDSKLVPFHKHQPFVIEDNGATTVGWLSGAVLPRIAEADAPLLFLGVDAEGAPYFAAHLGSADALGDLGRFEDLRGLAPRLTRDDLAILGCAKSIFEWNTRHGFCANCGARSEIVEAGWKRQCPDCKAEHFPRFDPVVIMVPTRGDQCALGRQKMWPKGMHSALAGFIEPGEAIEEAVARETMEEAGLRVSHVRVHSTQPWPFPHSLMIGALAEVEAGDIVVDTSELETARWFSRDEMKEMLAGKHPDCFCPPPFAIAHQLIKSWVEEG